MAYSTIVYHEVTESGARYAGQNGTDSEGKFKLTNLKAPSYILQGRAIGFIEESMMNPTGEPVKIGTSDVRLALQRGAVIKGLLLGPDGNPLAKTNVVLRWPQTATGARAAADLSEEDGTFEFKGLDDGEYTLLATSSGLKDITEEMKIVVSNRTSPEPVKLQATVAP